MSKEHKFYKRVISNASYLVLASVFTNIAMFITNVLTARYFEPADYGVITLIISINMSLVLLADMGIPMTVTTFIPTDISDNDRLGGLISSALTLTGIMILIAMVVLLLGSSWIAQVFLSPKNIHLVYLSLPWVGCYMLSRLINSVFHGFQHMGYSLLSAIIFESIRMVALFITLYLGLGINYIIAGWTISQLLAIFLIVVLFLVFLRKKKIKLKYLSNQKRRITKYSVFLILPFLGMHLAPYLLKILLGWLSNANEVAFLTVALSLSSLSLLLLAPISAAFLPVISESYATSNWQRMNMLAEISIKYLLLLSFGALCLLSLYGDKIINLIYGPKYLYANNSLIIIAFAVFLESSKAITNPMLTGTEHAQTITRIELLKFALLSFLGVGLIYTNGIMGASFALLISYSTSTVLKIYQVKKKLNINLIRIVLEFTPLVAVLVAVIFFGLPLWVFIIATLIVIFYFKMLSLREISLILSFYKK